MDRFSRQIPLIGPDGQKRLQKARIGIVGVGALGSAAVELFARAGVGYLRIIDRDLVDPSNLQRQHLFTQEDIGRPKATAAAHWVQAISPETEVDARTQDLNPDTVEDLLSDLDWILDGTDNLETRFLINDYCVKTGTPWVYGGAIRREGLMMPIVPGEGPCLRCLLPAPPSQTESCWAVGVTSMVTTLIAALQAEWIFDAITTGQTPHGFLYAVDLHTWSIRKVPIRRNPACRTCVQHDFEYLEGRAFRYAEVLCGQDTAQILPPKKGLRMDFQKIRQQLGHRVHLKELGGVLKIRDGVVEITLFRDGRALIKAPGITVERARALYAQYIGL